MSQVDTVSESRDTIDLNVTDDTPVRQRPAKIPDRPSLAPAGSLQIVSESYAESPIHRVQTVFNVAGEMREIYALSKVQNGGMAAIGTPIISLVRTLSSPARRELERELDARVCATLFLAGVVGGCLNGWMAVGPDLVTFFVMSLYMRKPMAAAIGASIQVAGHTSVLSGALQLREGNVPLHLWPMVIPGLWFGAKLGAEVLDLLGLIEFARAPEGWTPVGEKKQGSILFFLWPPAPASVLSAPERQSHYRLNALLLALLAVGVAIPCILMTPAAAAHAAGMPFMGIAGATIAVSTPVGGAILFIPVLMSMGISPKQAVAFGVATQAFGMGIFGFTFKLRKDKQAVRKSLQTTKWVSFTTALYAAPVPTAYPDALSAAPTPRLPQVLAGSWCGVLLALYGAPIQSDTAVRLLFSCMEAYLLAYCMFGMTQGPLPTEGDGLLHQLFFTHQSKWIESCSSQHEGCTSWEKQRGEARLGLIFKLLLFCDLVRTVVTVASTT